MKPKIDKNLIKGMRKMDRKTRKNFIQQISEKIKDIKKQMGDDVEINKSAYRLMAYEAATKVANKITGKKMSTEDYIRQNIKEKESKGKKSIYKLSHIGKVDGE